MIEKNYENGIKYFLVNCMPLSFSFDAEKISENFIVPAVTVRKIHDREVVSFYSDVSLTTYKYLRRIIVPGL